MKDFSIIFNISHLLNPLFLLSKLQNKALKKPKK